MGRRKPGSTTVSPPHFFSPVFGFTTKKVAHIERTKFNVGKDKEKRSYNGIIFDSILEMKYYRDVICPMMESGDVVECELQKPYVLQPKFIHDGRTVLPIIYVADFRIVYKDQHEEVIDTKGCPDPVSKVKRRMFWYLFPDISYKWIGYSKIDGGWLEYEVIKKQRALRKKEKAMKEQQKAVV